MECMYVTKCTLYSNITGMNLQMQKHAYRYIHTRVIARTLADYTNNRIV